ncbi:hypothetical protein PENSUB_1863 [Penicillium subrubescens]|uniref:Xaa-Pro dipeptidyl-peptidase C-terminal domain-containing protein n=1 Tax=Penicillium subrubescens TaxID=1316194 RepID=A0A1Q5UJ41_9EURO|nr:hypothetical protein PENSUB_1863 [Penicillium subrubescens]
MCEGAVIQDAACPARARGDWPCSRASRCLRGQRSHSTTRELGPGSFLTLRHFTAAGKEIPYTGSSGDAVAVTRGWLRASMRKVHTESPYHRPYLPRREYRSIDVQPVESGVIYECDVELWPTNVVVEKGGWLVLQVSSEVTNPGVDLFKHNFPIDRPAEKSSGVNNIHFDNEHENYLLLPVIP